MIIIEHVSDSGGKKRCQADFPFKGKHSKDIFCLIGEATVLEDSFEFSTAYLCGKCTDGFMYAMAEDDAVQVERTFNGFNLFYPEPLV